MNMAIAKKHLKIIRTYLENLGRWRFYRFGKSKWKAVYISHAIRRIEYLEVGFRAGSCRGPEAKAPGKICEFRLEITFKISKFANYLEYKNSRANLQQECCIQNEQPFHAFQGTFTKQISASSITDTPINIYMFKVNNRNTWKRCETSLRLTIRTQEWRQWRFYC